MSDLSVLQTKSQMTFIKYLNILTLSTRKSSADDSPKMFNFFQKILKFKDLLP